MQNHKALAALAAFICYATPCCGDWQYTRWGMSSQELQALSPNIVPMSAQDQQKHSRLTLGAPTFLSGYNAQDVSYTAYYYFRGDKLIGVSLQPQDQSAAARIANQLGLAYGQPIADNVIAAGSGCKSVKKTWRAATVGNVIDFFWSTCVNPTTGDIKDLGVDILYQPISQPGGSGL